MDVYELIARVRETAEDYGVIWPSTYKQLEMDLERLFYYFEQDIEDAAYQSGYSKGFDEGYDEAEYQAAG